MISQQWKNVILRVQQLSGKNSHNLATITLLLDENGEPLLWIEPQIKKLEPFNAVKELLVQMMVSLTR